MATSDCSCPHHLLFQRPVVRADGRSCYGFTSCHLSLPDSSWKTELRGNRQATYKPTRWFRYVDDAFWSGPIDPKSWITSLTSSTVSIPISKSPWSLSQTAILPSWTSTYTEDQMAPSAKLWLHGVTTQKTSTWIFTAVKTSNAATYYIDWGIPAPQKSVKISKVCGLTFVSVRDDRALAVFSFEAP
jgi:hypothetical protein